MAYGGYVSSFMLRMPLHYTSTTWYVISYMGKQGLMHGLWGLCIIVYAYYASVLYLNTSTASYVISYIGEQGLMHGLWGLCIIICVHYASALHEHCIVCDFLYGRARLDAWLMGALYNHLCSLCHCIIFVHCMVTGAVWVCCARFTDVD